MIDAVVFIFELLAMVILLHASDKTDRQKLKVLQGWFAYRSNPRQK